MDKIDLRYQRGKIYTIRCYDDDSLIYVGSTIQNLSIRMSGHRRGKGCCLYQYVIDNFNGDWKKWYIELYEEYPCNNKQLLEKREGEITRLIGNINKKISGRTNKEYYEDNKEKKLKYKKKYRNDNKEKILKKEKQYRNDNKENINYYKSEKVVCDHCGCESTKNNIKRHQKTNKCKNYNITKE